MFKVDPRLKREVTRAGLRENYDSEITRYKINEAKIIKHIKEKETERLINTTTSKAKTNVLNINTKDKCA